MIGKLRGNRRRLNTRTKSVVIYQDEVRSVALANDLERKLSCLEKENASIKHTNQIFDTKFKEASSHVDQFQGKFSKATVDIENLRNKNSESHNIIDSRILENHF